MAVKPAKLALCVIVLLGWVFVDQAAAWGPGVHIELANRLMECIHLLPAGVAVLLRRRFIDFQFGSIAPDAIFAKKLAKLNDHCHHWQVALGLLDAARSDRQRAFAYGYMAHLAADTVAHNKFIPRQTLATRTTLHFGHCYWELRADSYCPPEVWQSLRQLSLERFPQHAELMRDQLRPTILTFDANTWLFDGLNRLVSASFWVRTLVVGQRLSRHRLCEHMLEQYKQESMDRIFDLLCRPHTSYLLDHDPIGTEANSFVKTHRRHLRRLERRGLLAESVIREAVAAREPAARNGGHIAS